MTRIESDGFLSDEAIEGRSVFRGRFSDVFALAEDVNRIAVKRLSQAKLADIVDGHFVLYLLTIRIVESFEAIVILMERGMLSPAKLIVRPILEALFTLAALEKNKELIAKYFDTQSEAHFALLRSSTKWRNEDLKRLFRDSKLEEKYIEKKKERKESPPESLRPIQWAEAAGYEDFYHLHYVQYASFTHSNLSALEDHMDMDGEAKVEASFGPSANGFFELLIDATNFTLLSVMHMCSAFQIEIDQDADRIQERVEILCSKYKVE
ncbi:DUF5677 domain-containing protein [Polaromonas sp.]|uniref:DUF5677 domain-containing protein n=1 Tax=Polaromonas sp. TaxID=1869339 RepID=UPI002487C622|nr:DUF5677 domain-containing protein [Polaromonas sp.]MDI1339269.1 DUF5677 domain-containing protein [Polaromonas sp.]